MTLVVYCRAALRRADEASAPRWLLPRFAQEQQKRSKACSRTGVCAHTGDIRGRGRPRHTVLAESGCRALRNGVEFVGVAEIGEEPRPEGDDDQSSDASEDHGTHGPEPVGGQAGFELSEFV